MNTMRVCLLTVDGLGFVSYIYHNGRNTRAVLISRVGLLNPKVQWLLRSEPLELPLIVTLQQQLIEMSEALENLSNVEEQDEEFPEVREDIKVGQMSFSVCSVKQRCFRAPRVFSGSHGEMQD